MFVDDWLIEDLRGLRLSLNKPERKEIALELNRPWEGSNGTYFTALQDEEKVRLYYRGYMAPGAQDISDEQRVCYAESADGIHFTRPELGLYAFDGSTRNNIVFQGPLAHNFTPFLDRSPHAVPKERYKAVGGTGTITAAKNDGSLYGLTSPDGIHWREIEQRLIGGGGFDSQNVAFWDPNAQAYRCYNRYFHGGKYRAVQSCSSPDFIHWSEQQHNEYEDDAPMEHFYTNATIVCPGAEHMYLAFPKRFVPGRKKIASHAETGLSDTCFMTSRDGVRWNRTFMEAWLRPGRDDRNWTDRSNMVAFGCIETGPDEFSLYATEHYRWDSNRLRRLSVRKHGFASVSSSYAGGEMVTRPIVLEGDRLHLNYSTSAAGFIRVEVQDAEGRALPGFTLEDAEPLFGDNVEEPFHWKGGVSLSALRGYTIRLRFEMRDADLYALRFK
ncbi:MAG: hypothetical protein K0Q59_3426 [Paenibacillus sp.]|jgi:hypothetical protein|nr:hypothetical protein [Paenibacillus sp.]